MTTSSHSHTPTKRRAVGRLNSATVGLSGLKSHMATDQGQLLTLAPLPMLVALEELCRRLGKAVTKAQLTAALPMGEGEMPKQFAPIALARAGLQAHWLKLPVERLTPQDVPALLRLNDGGAVLVLAIGAGGRATILEQSGEHQVELTALQGLVEGEILSCGHVDPENGLDDEGERDLLRRNPRLWLLGAYMGERKKLGQLIVAGLLLNLCGLTIPLYMRAIYDRVVPNLAISSLWALSAGVVLALIFELLLRRVKSGFVDGIGVRVGQAVQHRAVTSVLHARMNHADNSVGSLMTALRDTEQLSLLVPQAIVTFVVDLPSIFAYCLLIALIGGWTALGPILGAAALLAVGFVTNFALKLASKRSSRLQQARNNLIVEVAEGWQTIKANQAEGRFLARWDTVSDHIGISSRDVRHWNELPGALSGLFVQLVTVFVVVIGVFQIKSGAMTTGALIAVIMLTSRAMGPVATAISTMSRLYQSMAQLTGLARILQTEPERRLSDPTIAAEAIAGDIRVVGLGYRFEGASQDSLKDLSFNVEAGERIAVIGRSGSGKSTLLQLLAGLLPHQSGVITLGGHAVDQYAVAQLRRAITYSAQDAEIFDTSIWDNILLGLPEPDQALVERAIRCSGLDAFVSRSVEGYMRKTGARGSALSGGQRQMIVLARALIRDPAIMLLDEPTASLDITSEQSVINGLREATAGKTLIIATHRLALLDLVDRVIWLDEGKLVADRPKLEVLAMLREANGRRATAA